MYKLITKQKSREKKTGIGISVSGLKCVFFPSVSVSVKTVCEIVKVGGSIKDGSICHLSIEVAVMKIINEYFSLKRT